MIEIPPKFAGKPPVHPEAREPARRPGAARPGLAEDVRRYGAWMRDEAYKRIGHLYPPIEITEEMAKDRPDLKPYVGEKLTVIAWLWARTVKSPNPAFSHVDVPLVSTFMLEQQGGEGSVCRAGDREGGYRFTVKVGKPAGWSGENGNYGRKAVCLSVPHVGRTDCVRPHTGRRRRPHGRTS